MIFVTQKQQDCVTQKLSHEMYVTVHITCYIQDIWHVPYHIMSYNIIHMTRCILRCIRHTICMICMTHTKNMTCHIQLWTLISRGSRGAFNIFLKFKGPHNYGFFIYFFLCFCPGSRIYSEAPVFNTYDMSSHTKITSFV